MGKSLTVVVPAYNIEKYLEKCLDSLVCHPMPENLEVLVVDDGSADHTPAIAKKYVAMYPSVFRYIRQENGGHGAAIETGIRHAAGKYFKVLDGDDWVDTKAFQSLLQHLRRWDSDLLYSNYAWVDHTTGKTSLEFPRPFDGVVYGKEYHFDQLPPTVFLKMHGFTIKTELMRKIPPIDHHCFYVDMEYVLFPIPQIQTVRFLSEVVYQYRIGLLGQSVSAEKMQRNGTDFDRVLNHLLTFYTEERAALSDTKQSYLAYALARLVASRYKIFLMQPNMVKAKVAMQQLDKCIQTEYPEIYNANQNKAVALLRKSRFGLFAIASPMCRKLMK